MASRSRCAFGNRPRGGGYGLKATVETVHDHDFHATISYWMVLDHERRTYRHAGCDYRLTDVQGSLVQSVLA